MKFSIEADFFYPKNISYLNYYMFNVDLSNYNGIIVAGDDGSFFNVLNACLKRKDKVDIPFDMMPVEINCSPKAIRVFSN